jgi:hypothetical protein
MWIVAFGRNFRSNWSDFVIPEQEKGFFPLELSLNLFSKQQANEVAKCLVEEAGLPIEQAVVDNLINSAAVGDEVLPVDIGIGLLTLASLHSRLQRMVTLNDYHFSGGAEGLLTTYIEERTAVFPDTDREKLLHVLLALYNPIRDQRIPEGRTCLELAQIVGAEESRLKAQLNRLVQRDMRLLELLAPEDGGEPRYRLPHDRFIKALRQLNGTLLIGVDQARIELERSFSSWRTWGQNPRHLLRGRGLRLVNRYMDQIPLGEDADLKRGFLEQSLSRRNLVRLGQVAAGVLLLAACWIGAWQFGRFQDQAYLEEVGYPAALVDWQDRLQTLILEKPLNLRRLRGLHSTSLVKLGLKAGPDEELTSGLGTLKRCSRMTEITLDLSSGNVRNLVPLGELTNLTNLTLNLDYSKTADLRPLGKLTKLTHLTLNLTGSRVADLTPLENLTKGYNRKSWTGG